VDVITDQIGEQLRQAREKAGLTREDVVFQTRLPRSAIEALESEDFSSFVSPVYAKSFLAQYSKFLNVDAGRWLDALNPSNFIEGDPLFPLLDSRRGPQVAHAATSESGGNWMGAIQVFKFSEIRYGQDGFESEKVIQPKPPQKPKIAVEPPPAPVASVVTPAEEAAAALVEEQPQQPAPRALNVR